MLSAARRAIYRAPPAFAAVTATVSRPRRAGGQRPAIRFGYAAMTWGKEERQAVDDIGDGPL